MKKAAHHMMHGFIKENCCASIYFLFCHSFGDFPCILVIIRKFKTTTIATVFWNLAFSCKNPYFSYITARHAFWYTFPIWKSLAKF